MQQIDTSLLMQYLDPKLIIVLVALWAVGYMLKQWDGVKDKWIIGILSGLSIILTFLILGLTVQAFLQGIIAAALAVYCNQLIKQSKKDE